MSRPPPHSGYLPGQSSVLADLLSRRDQVMGAAWSFHPLVAIALLSAWGFPSLDLFAMGLPAVLPLFCSFVPNPWVILLDAFCVHWGTLGMYALRPSCCRMGGWLEPERPPFSPRLWLPPTPTAPPHLAGVEVVRSPSPSLLKIFPVLFRRGKMMSVSPVSGSQSALNCLGPAGLGSHVLSWIFLCSFEISRCRRTCGVAFPREVVPQGLARGLCVPFGSSVERFLAQSLLFLLALASSGITGILHFLRFESLTPELSMVYPSPLSRFVVAKALDLLCSSV